jgi:hypothetical protein
MKQLLILLQFGVKIGESLSTFQLIFIWGTIGLFVVLFVYFLYKTDKLIAHKVQVPVDSKQTNIGQVSDEEAAAIAMAIHLYKAELHDKESLTITLKKVSRIYSPWSSKIYTLRNNPR